MSVPTHLFICLHSKGIPVKPINTLIQLSVVSRGLAEPDSGLESESLNPTKQMENLLQAQICARPPHVVHTTTVNEI